MANDELTPANFKKELKDLLEKYGAYISMSASYCSDWSGINDEYMYAYVGDTQVVLCNENFVDSRNIKR